MEFESQEPSGNIRNRIATAHCGTVIGSSYEMAIRLISKYLIFFFFLFTNSSLSRSVPSNRTTNGRKTSRMTRARRPPATFERDNIKSVLSSAENDNNITFLSRSAHRSRSKDAVFGCTRRESALRAKRGYFFFFVLPFVPFLILPSRKVGTGAERYKYIIYNKYLMFFMILYYIRI